MASITNSTFNLLVFKSSAQLSDNYEKTLEFFLDNVINRKILFYSFNNLERSRLFTAKMLLKDEKLFISHYYNKLKEKKDDLRFVFSKGGRYKFHIYEDCKLIKNSYLDFKVPVEISNLGYQITEEYRKWFVENQFKEMYISSKNQELVNYEISRRYNDSFVRKYNFKPMPTTFDFIIMNENSGQKSISYEFDKNQFNKKLEHLINERNNLLKNNDFRIKLASIDWLYYKDEKTITDTIDNKFGFGTLEKYGMENFKKFWHRHKAIKSKIYNLLIDFFKWEYNFKEKDYEVIDLEKLGFECCKNCQTTFTNQSPPTQ